MLESTPTVGLTVKFGEPEQARDYYKNYIDALRQHGAKCVILSPDTPVTLPDGETFTPDTEGRLPLEILEHLDGLVLAGGGDVHPSYFGAEMAGANERSIHIPRDELELSLTRQALDMDMPVFGICRGFQVMNVAAGGGMVQDFGGHRSPRDNPFLHDLIIDKASRLYQIVGCERLATNTYHHQGVDAETIAPLFQCSGVIDGEEWLIEAFESPEHRWVLGVQWHPERLYELPELHHNLWANFVAACRDA